MSPTGGRPTARFTMPGSDRYVLIERSGRVFVDGTLAGQVHRSDVFTSKWVYRPVLSDGYSLGASSWESPTRSHYDTRRQAAEALVRRTGDR